MSSEKKEQPKNREIKSTERTTGREKKKDFFSVSLARSPLLRHLTRIVKLSWLALFSLFAPTHTRALFPQ